MPRNPRWYHDIVVLERRYSLNPIKQIFSAIFRHFIVDKSCRTPVRLRLIASGIEVVALATYGKAMGNVAWRFYRLAVDRIGKKIAQKFVPFLELNEYET